MHIPISRRRFIKTSSVLLVGAAIGQKLNFNQKSIRFGWVTDVHYADAKVKWERYYSESLGKLQEAVDLFNEQMVDFVIETGDFKDQKEPSFEEDTIGFLIRIESVFARFNGDRFHVLGNHDMDSISKIQFLTHIQNSGITKGKSYYYFERSEMRFVVLDACFTGKGIPYSHHNYHWKDTYVPKEELEWLKITLAESKYPVYIFIHQLLDGTGDVYVNNSTKVRKMLEKSGKVKAVFQGHFHQGQISDVNGILYYTLKCMVEGTGKENSSYSIVNISPGGDIVIEGYRKADDYEFRST